MAIGDVAADRADPARPSFDDPVHEGTAAVAAEAFDVTRQATGASQGPDVPSFGQPSGGTIIRAA
jgi:hypothetical protein